MGGARVDHPPSCPALVQNTALGVCVVTPSSHPPFFHQPQLAEMLREALRMFDEAFDPVRDEHDSQPQSRRRDFFRAVHLETERDLLQALVGEHADGFGPEFRSELRNGSVECGPYTPSRCKR